MLLSVDDFVDMKVLERTNNLDQIILDLHLSESFPSFDQFIQGMICTNFKQNVNIFMIFEHMLEFDDMVVI